jgi:alginate O-acetyltransferase complex protein AlgI
MVFASQVFLYWFLPLVLVGTLLLPRWLRNPFLTVASFIFYGWWRPDYALLMLATATFDFVAALMIDRAHRHGSRGVGWLVLSVVANLGLLAWFKYANFAVGILNDVFVWQGSEPVPWVDVLLPIGISFYTFQSMSYTIDVWRRDLPATRHFGDFLCFVSLFPQLVAGPIVRYSDVADQMARHKMALQPFAQGVLWFIFGLSKKVLVADMLAPVVNGAFDAGVPASAGLAWTGLAAYTLQLYCDFSGYSDMAIGLGLMLGLRFPFNFESPYKSASMTEFWRRWHITLSTWLRDYLYIPLGGNRKGPLRTQVNLLLTMLLGGLWHGANWTFIAWGAWHGLMLSLERVKIIRRAQLALPRPGQVLLTLLCVMLGWALFRAHSLTSAWEWCAALVGHGGSVVLVVAPLQYAVLALAGALALFAPSTRELVARASRRTVVFAAILLPLTMIHLHWQDHVPFLYYQF